MNDLPNIPRALLRRLAATAGGCAAALGLVACGMLESSEPSDGVVAVTGKIASGAGPSAVPLPGASVWFFRASPTPTPAVAHAVADAQGRFAVLLPSGAGVIYGVARHGITTELISVLGDLPPTDIVINEMTTVAAAYGMAQFINESGITGPALPLRIAAGMALNLADPVTGMPSATIRSSPNGDETNAWRSLGTLSNVLASCVRSSAGACNALFAAMPSLAGEAPRTTFEAIRNLARNPVLNVTQIFQMGDTSPIYAPALTPQQGPASQDLLQRLDAWTLAVKFNASGSTDCLFGGPGNIAFDRRGYAWITNNVVQGTPDSADCMMVLRPDGRPSDGAQGTPRSALRGGGIKGQGFGIAIDPSDRVWAGNFGWGADIPVGSVSVFAPDGTPLSPSSGYVGPLQSVQGTASDPQGSIWMASYRNHRVVAFPGGANQSALTPHERPDSLGPFGVAVADDGTAWVTFSDTSSVSRLRIEGAEIARLSRVEVGTNSVPKGIALDSAGNAWVAGGRTSEVFQIAPDGNLVASLSGRGLSGPWGLTVDARDNVWIANFGDPGNATERYSVVRLCGITLPHCPPGMQVGDRISPPGGYTLPSAGEQVRLASGSPLYGALAPPSFKPLMRPTVATVDMAGNVWVTNNWKPSGLNDIEGNPGGDGIVVFVGLGAPTRAPAIGQPKAP